MGEGVSVGDEEGRSVERVGAKEEVDDECEITSEEEGDVEGGYGAWEGRERSGVV